MSRNARILSAIAAAALLVAIGLAAYANLTGGSGADSPELPAAARRGPAVAAGKLAADFTLKDLNGRTVSLSALRGKVVFLNIWATWCGPCRDEMPSIESLYEKFNADRDFVVLAVSQDTDGKLVAPFVKKNNLKFTIVLDPRNVVGDTYDVSGIPETFIIDRDGRIVAHHLGPYDWANPEIRDALQELINSKSG